MKNQKKPKYPWTNERLDTLQENFEGSEEYLKGVNEAFEQLQASRILPSKFQFGDDVEIDYGSLGRVTGGKIIMIHFSEGCVFYDIEITCEEDKWSERLYKVSAAHVVAKDADEGTDWLG